MIKAIIFDFFGVIGADSGWVWFRKNVPNLDERKDYFMRLTEKVDKGTISPSEFFSTIAKDTAIPKERVGREIYEGVVINKELLLLLRRLKKDYKIGLLTNSHREFIEEILNKNRLISYFDELIISSDYHIIKPDPRIFQKMLEMLGVQASEAIFVDDRQYNVEAANKLGIKSILYTSNKQLETDLRGLTLI